MSVLEIVSVTKIKNKLYIFLINLVPDLRIPPGTSFTTSMSTATETYFSSTTFQDADELAHTGKLMLKQIFISLKLLLDKGLNELVGSLNWLGLVQI